MDINEKINWMPGMELTAAVFRQFEDNILYRQILSLRAALGNAQLGLLPGSEYSCKGVFVKNTFEIDRLKCLAILPSGNVINADEEVSVVIPMLYGDEYFLAIGISNDTHDFEKEGVPYVRPVYSYGIYTREDLSKKELFPLKRFKVSDGVFSVDEDYIVPVLYLRECGKLSDYRDSFIRKIEKITLHQNLEEGDGKRSLLRYLFIFKSIKNSVSTADFISLTQELAQAVDYFIMRPNVEAEQEIPEPDFYDIGKWLTWLDGYLAGAISVLAKVVLVDSTIDYNALLEQAKRELYERLSPELLEKLPNQVKTELYKEVTDKLKEFLPEYLLGKLEELKKSVGKEVEQEISPRLFEDLYEKLYAALYIPPEDEDEFMPMI